MLNALTIDLEDYFQVHAFSDIVELKDWDRFECRVERNADRILGLLNLPAGGQKPSACTKATFFVLGWIAERYPGLIRSIKEQGHEIACHGYTHKLVSHQSREEFREDVRRAKSILEDIVGGEIIGYRAPSYSITRHTMWALEVLMDEGFRYDSSIFPIHHDVYGIPDAHRFPFTVSRNGGGGLEFIRGCHRTSPSLIEFPISTLRILGKNLPVSGGGYFRLFPYCLIESALKRINEKEKMPFVFYIHPWELDGEQPRIPNASLRSRFRHYVNLSKTEARLRSLLEQFEFAPVRDLLDHQGFHQES